MFGSFVSTYRERRSALGADAGITIVEMIVATLILGVGIAGAATLLVGASNTAAVSGNRRTATEIGVEEIERIRSWPYGVVGIMRAAPAYVPTFERLPTVTETGENRLEPTGSETREGVDYDVARYVTWLPIEVNRVLLPQGYKRLTIGISWTDSAGDHTVWHETGLFESSDDA